MRLIDADALIADLEHDVAINQDSLDYEEMTEDRREIIQFDKDCKQNAIDLLNHAPTIEPEHTLIPVVKEQILQAGYEGREVRFHIGGRLFAIRELAQ